MITTIVIAALVWIIIGLIICFVAQAEQEAFYNVDPVIVAVIWVILLWPVFLYALYKDSRNGRH